MKTLEVTKEEFKGNIALALTLLEVSIPEAVSLQIEETESAYLFHAETDTVQDYGVVYQLPLEEQLRYLMNIGQLYEALKASAYTYSLTPDNLVFTQNGIAKIIFRGVKGQVPPYEEITEATFLKHYKSMIISVLDTKAKYEELAQGKLEFYKGHKFTESILSAETIEAVVSLLNEHLEYEKQRVAKEMVRVPRKRLFTWKLTGILFGVLSVIFASLLGYHMFVTQPQQQTIANVRLSFIQKDYSKVVSSVKNMDSKSLSPEDKYIVAYSVIMTEPLTDAQKTTLGKITTQTNEDYLRYWVLIGQNKIDEAMDIASYLDDPQLLMYGLTKKIDDIQRDPSLTSEKRTEEINRYKGKLEELKKQYLPTQQKTKEN